MNNYTITTANTSSKLKTSIKKETTQILVELLMEKYGSENVSMVRKNKVNLIAVKDGIVTDAGGEHTICFTVNVSVPEYTTRRTTNRTIEAFDFEEAQKEYFNYMADKAK